ncbi:MAG: hypothetical protein LBP28_03630, partial [Coriobacteriales bacterium]|nr:hypothetical protein [Coriobacteriales bacterium]
MSDKPELQPFKPTIGKDILDRANNRFSPQIWQYINNILENEHGKDWRQKAKADIETNDPKRMTLFSHDNSDENDLRLLLNYFWSKNIVVATFQTVLQTNYKEFFSTLLTIKGNLNKAAHFNEAAYKTTYLTNGVLMNMVKLCNIIGDFSLMNELTELRQELAQYKDVIEAESAGNYSLWPTLEDLIIDLTQFAKENPRDEKELSECKEAKELLHKMEASSDSNIFAVVGDIGSLGDVLLKINPIPAFDSNFFEDIANPTNADNLLSDCFSSVLLDVAQLLLYDKAFEKHPLAGKRICLLKSRMRIYLQNPFLSQSTTIIEEMLIINSMQKSDNLLLGIYDVPFTTAERGLKITIFNNDWANDSVMLGNIVFVAGVNSGSRDGAVLNDKEIPTYRLTPLEDDAAFLSWKDSLMSQLQLDISDDANRRIFEFLLAQRYARLAERQTRWGGYDPRKEAKLYWRILNYMGYFFDGKPWIGIEEAARDIYCDTYIPRQLARKFASELIESLSDEKWSGAGISVDTIEALSLDEDLIRVRRITPIIERKLQRRAEDLFKGEIAPILKYIFEQIIGKLPYLISYLLYSQAQTTELQDNLLSPDEYAQLAN